MWHEEGTYSKLAGTHHRGIDDARNIAKIYVHLKNTHFPNKWA